MLTYQFSCSLFDVQFKHLNYPDYVMLLFRMLETTHIHIYMLYILQWWYLAVCECFIYTVFRGVGSQAFIYEATILHKSVWEVVMRVAFHFYVLLKEAERKLLMRGVTQWIDNTCRTSSVPILFALILSY